MEITKEMLKSGNVFHCDTEEKQNELFNKLDKMGCKWAGGKPLLEENYYDYYKDQTCYSFWNDMELCFEDVDYYNKEGTKIMEYTLDE